MGPYVPNTYAKHAMLQESKNNGESRQDSGDSTACAKAYVIIKPELCKACGLCVEFCPKNVLKKGKAINNMGYEYTVYCGEGCIGCGTCFYVCPEPDAIQVFKKQIPENDRLS